MVKVIWDDNDGEESETIQVSNCDDGVVEEATPPDVANKPCRNENEHIGHYWSDGNPDLGYYCEGRRRG